MKTLKILFILLIASFLRAAQLPSQTPSMRGQISAWATINYAKSTESQLGLRYIPEFSYEKYISESYSVISEMSFNSYGTSLFRSAGNIETDGNIKPYRMWIKFSASQFEIRLGLQKINFGSASLMRPLMWFDRIDPRDPLQMTDGVVSALGRYYFLNNANIWLWALYGNDETKGLETLPSDKNKVEYGGRVQLPVFTGEVGLTYHHRKANVLDQPLSTLLSTENSIPENRIGFDFKMDVGIGLWFEGALIHQDVLIKDYKYQRLSTIGLDYTFPIANGVYAMTEYFTMTVSDQSFQGGSSYSFSAASLNYPINIVDSVTFMAYYNSDNSDWYRFINWQRMYDQWSFYFIGFWNPEQFQMFPNLQGNNPFAGKGFQLMVVYNY